MKTESNAFVAWAFGLAFTVHAVAFERDRVDYRGYSLIHTEALEKDDQVIAVKQILQNYETSRQVFLMNDVRIEIGRDVWLLVSPIAYEAVRMGFGSRHIIFRIIDDDIQRTMDEKAQLNADAIRTHNHRNQGRSNSIAANDHTAYLPYDEQMNWMLNKAAEAGNIATAFPVGTSYEGRSIYAVAINGNNLALPVVWIHGNANPRDWLTSATALYLVDQILNGNSTDAAYLRANFRWFITPNLNPDGYEYTRNFDRVWMKTLSLGANQSGCAVPGVYAVGNFDANFGGAGCSANPCADTYCGAGAFSELETRAVSDFMASLTGTLALFVSLDSFGQQWLVPYGCYPTKPSDYEEMRRVANAAADAVRQTNGLVFAVGTPVDLTGPSTGAAFDWGKLRPRFNYAYSVRTRPATPGEGGFDLPPDQIIPSGRELFAGIASACRELLP